MAKLCKYRVVYGSEVARFSNRADAFIFARQAGYSEVSNATGIIAQFAEGKLTPEFKNAR